MLRIFLGLATVIPLTVVIGGCGSGSPKFQPSPAQYSAMVIDKVRDQACGRADDRRPITAGAWIVDDPEGRKNRAVVAVKVRIADRWVLVKEAPSDAPLQNLIIEFLADTGVKTVGQFIEPDPEAVQIGDYSSYLLLYGVDERFAAHQDNEGYRILIFQQPIEWTGSTSPQNVTVEITYQALSGDRQTDPQKMTLTATHLN